MYADKVNNTGWKRINYKEKHGSFVSRSGFGGAEVACLPVITKFAGSNPAEAVGFLQGDKNPQHAFHRKGSKIIGPMS